MPRINVVALIGSGARADFGAAGRVASGAASRT
jgi:hypothetical protein